VPAPRGISIRERVGETSPARSRPEDAFADRRQVFSTANGVNRGAGDPAVSDEPVLAAYEAYERELSGCALRATRDPEIAADLV
jgi:hypothetical protein